MYCLNLMRIALELALHNPVYEDIATKFFEHFLHIAEAMTNIGGDGHRACGTRRTSSTTTSCNLPDGADDAAQGALDGRADPAVRGRDARAGAAASGCRSSPSGCEWFLELPARPGDAGVALARAGHGRAAAAVAAARPPHEDAAAADARRDRVPLRLRRARALAAPRATHPYVFALRRPALDGRVRAGRVDVGPVRRQLELARADLVPGELPDHRVAAEVPSLLRRRLQGRVPDRLGPVHDHRRGRRRAVARG